MHSRPSFLIIQTAFIGDVILATALIEKIYSRFPDSSIDFLLRKGNEDLLRDHPHLRKVWIWDKKKGKIKNLISLTRQIRTQQYTCVINVHRFGSSGMITAFSGAQETIGFDKNPFSMFFTTKVKHEIGSLHEVERNQKLIAKLTDDKPARPSLYPTVRDQANIQSLQSGNYVCIAPASVWYTKQFPKEKWIELVKQLEGKTNRIYLLGAPSDEHLCQSIAAGGKDNITILAGKLNFLESAALMKGAVMNYVNDSAPMHLASAVNAPVSAVFCSTVPSFGFGPLSDKSNVIETKENLPCRPCGLHGHKRCPQGHFKCAVTIDVTEMARLSL